MTGESMKMSLVCSLNDELMELVLLLNEDPDEAKLTFSLGEAASIIAIFSETEESTTLILTTSIMSLSSNSSLAVTNGSYAIDVEIELPIDEQSSKETNSIQLRGEILTEDWDRLDVSASASVPFGYYAVDGFYMLDDTSLSLNGSILSPSFSGSFKAGGSYEYTEDDISGEVFVWENKIYAGCNLQSGNITAKVEAVLPDTDFDPFVLKCEVLEEMPTQITVTADIQKELHFFTTTYQLADVDFELKVSILTEIRTIDKINSD